MQSTNLRAQLRANVLLILAAMIWGGAFVAQSVGNSIGSFTFNGVRSLIGVAALLPVIAALDQRRKHVGAQRQPWPWKPGIACGVLVTVATTLQQFGLNYTSAGKAGFITALYIVLVPLVTLVRDRVRVGRTNRRTLVQTAAALVLAVSGMYFLCITGSVGGVGAGDLLVFGCAVVFTFQILIVDRVAAQVDCLKLCCIQFAVCGVCCTSCAVIFEAPAPLLEAWVPLVYAGVLSCGVAYTLQMLGQRDSDPTVAALIMSLESVFAVLSGWLILREQLTARELAGCALMAAAIVLVQVKLPSRRKT